MTTTLTTETVATADPTLTRLEPIVVRRARTHNLQEVSLAIPRNRLVVFTGVSGSGKSSLVFDTLYTEAQRQLIETFSTFARRRLPKLSRPEVDGIDNLSTAILIDQKRMGRTLRSTVGTATEVFTYLRLLFSRLGRPFIGPSYRFSFNHPEGMCPSCQGLGKRIRIDGERLLDPGLTLRQGAVTHPDYRVGGWNWKELIHCGLFDADRRVADFTNEERDRLLYGRDIPIVGESAGIVYAKKFEGIAAKLERLYLHKAEDELPEAKKDAYQKYLVYSDCDACSGTRLRPEALIARLHDRTIAELADLELGELDRFLSGVGGEVAEPLVRKMRAILSHLIDIGVGYLSLNRSVATLSGGESQRVKMARQMDCDLVGLMYVLDEPSIGLHPRDIRQLIAMLRRLRDRGNSVLVVEHDPEIIAEADHVFDLGPAAGSGGGKLCFSGTPAELRQADCPTGSMLRSRHRPARPRRPWTEGFRVEHANRYNLKDISVTIPKRVLVCVTGVAGSGKSTLIREHFLRRHPEAVVIDQNPVGRNSRSNPLTWTGVFDAVRREFARATGRPASLFSFNSTGACPECGGQGVLKIEMHFMDSVEVVCSRCEGQRYTEEVLALRYQGRNIHECLSMTVEQARGFFRTASIRNQLETLQQVGLGYLELGQPLSALSGGEAQRLKLAGELGRSGNLYVLDEPTTGLHLADIERLVGILERLVETGNSVIVIEHNLDVIARADWVIDLGPEGGRAGGRVIAEGTPETVAACPESHTGRYLAGWLNGSREAC